MTDREYLTIGEVLRALEDEFPDLSISKIRFLEDQGIIDPQRTGGGYRKFLPADVRRLETALRLQRDHFLPLTVIRERLREAEHGAAAPTVQAELPVLTTTELPQDEQGQVVVEDLLKATGIEPDFVRALEGFGLLQVRSLDGVRVLHAREAEIVQASHQMTRYGLEPRHLRMYETFAERQVAFFAQILLPTARQRSPEAQHRLLSTLADLADGADALNRLLLRRALGREFPDFNG